MLRSINNFFSYTTIAINLRVNVIFILYLHSTCADSFWGVHFSACIEFSTLMKQIFTGLFLCKYFFAAKKVTQLNIIEISKSKESFFAIFCWTMNYFACVRLTTNYQTISEVNTGQGVVLKFDSCDIPSIKVNRSCIYSTDSFCSGHFRNPHSYQCL